MATSVFKILLTNPNFTTATTARDFIKTSRHVEAVALSNYLQNLASGLAHGSGATLAVSELGSQTQATGTITFASATAADTVTVGTVVFTAVSGTPSGNQFKVGVSNNADALSLVAAINANATLSPYVIASANSAVVTVTGINLGAVGNMLILSSSNGSRLAVVAMASGVDATTTSYNF